MSNVQLDLEDLRKWAAFSFFTGILPPKTSGLNSMSLISFWRFVEWADLSSTAFKRLTQKSLLPTIGFTVSSFIISLKKSEKFTESIQDDSFGCAQWEILQIFG